MNNDIDLYELINHLEVGKNWKEAGCDHVVTITEIDSGFANNIMVAFESDCCLSSSPLGMFLKDFTPVINNDMSKSDSEIDINENSVDGVNMAFKVGDKVYKYGETDVKTVLEVFEDGYMRISNYPHRVNHEVLCHATPKNHAVLSKPFPAIEFEQPLTQADIDNEAVDKLAQAMKNKLAKKREQGYHGWETCKHGDLVQLLINHVDEGDPIDVANFCAFLFARGEQLTQGGTR